MKILKVFFSICIMLFLTANALAECDLDNIITPNGGEHWSGTQTISWNYVNPAECTAVSADLYYSIDDGANWIAISGHPANGASTYNWNTVPFADGSNYKIKVEEPDGSVSSTRSANFFTIDNTPPTLTDITGLSKEELDDEITITFSEDMKESLVENPNNWIIENPDGSALTITNANFDYNSNTYTLTITLDEATDDAYLTNGNKVCVTPSNLEDISGNLISNSEVCSTTDVSGDSDNPTIQSITAIPNIAKDESVTIEVVFDEDLSIMPTVQVTGLTSSPYGVNEVSFDRATNKWTGTVTILDDDEETTATITATGAVDLAGNAQDALNVSNTFLVDTIDPVMTINTPLNNAVIRNSNKDVEISFTATDTNRDNCYYAIDGDAPIQLIDCNSPKNITVQTDGWHNITLIADDTAGNSDDDTVQVLVDSDSTLIVGVDYSTIQEAINAANDYETVYVQAGTYYENLVINNKKITLTGADKATTIVDGSGSGTIVFVSSTTDVEISGFTITGSGANPLVDGGILLYGVTDSVIEDNIIKNNDGFGIGLQVSNSNIIQDNALDNNSIAGIGLLGSSHNKVISNDCENTNQLLGDYGYGIVLDAVEGNNPPTTSSFSINNTLNDNTCSNNEGDGIYLGWNSDNNIITNNIVDDNANNGIYLWKASFSTITDNTLTNNDEEGIHLMASHDNNVTYNTITENKIGIKIRSGHVQYAYPAVALSENNNINFNIILDNTNYGVNYEQNINYTDDNNLSVNAIHNWWGNNDGPAWISAISANVLYDQWCMDSGCSMFTSGVKPSTSDDVPAGWQTSDVTVTLNCNDGATGSGCSKVYYTVDGQDPTINSSFVDALSSWQFVISSDDEYTVKYRGYDNAGNLEDTKTAVNTLQLDKTNPTISIIDDASIIWTNSDKINVTINDVTSLIAETRSMIINNTDSCDGAKDTLLDAGVIGDTVIANDDSMYFNKSICFRTMDNAGNKNYAMSNILDKLDTTAPDVDVGNAVNTNTQFFKNATTNDSFSGITSYNWTLISGPGIVTFGSSTSEDTTIQADTDGTYYIKLTVIDNAGNEGSDQFTLIWDASPSEANGPDVSPNPVVAGQSATFTGVINDQINVAGARLEVRNSADSVIYTENMTASDGNFDETTEIVELTVSGTTTAGWATGTYSFWISGKDIGGNWQIQTEENTDTFTVTTSGSGGTSSTPSSSLTITSSSPSGIITNNAPTLEIGTSENAKCKYSSSAFDFDTQGILMSGEGTTAHSASLGTLADGNYMYYVICEDGDNVKTNYFPMAFRVDTTGNFDFTQELNNNWNALWLPTSSVMYDDWGYNNLWTLKEAFDNSGITGNYDVVWYYDSNLGWIAYSNDGNDGNDNLNTAYNTNNQPYWIKMTSADRFEVN